MFNMVMHVFFINTLSDKLQWEIYEQLSFWNGNNYKWYFKSSVTPRCYENIWFPLVTNTWFSSTANTTVVCLYWKMIKFRLVCVCVYPEIYQGIAWEVYQPI